MSRAGRYVPSPPRQFRFARLGCACSTSARAHILPSASPANSTAEFGPLFQYTVWTFGGHGATNQRYNNFNSGPESNNCGSVSTITLGERGPAMRGLSPCRDSPPGAAPALLEGVTEHELSLRSRDVRRGAHGPADRLHPRGSGHPDLCASADRGGLVAEGLSENADSVIDQPARRRKEVTALPSDDNPFSTHARRTYG